MSQHPPRRAIDWAGVRLRIECAEMAMKDALDPGPREAKAIMDARARALAKVPEARGGQEITDVVGFTLGRERYAIETRYVREVAAFAHYMPVPGTPEFLVGVTNLRGTVLAVMDLRTFFNIPRKGVTDLAHVIVLGGARAEFGILVDALQGHTDIPAAEVRPPAEVSGLRNAYLKGVTRDAILLLDGAKLLADERLTIDHAHRHSSS